MIQPCMGRLYRRPAVLSAFVAVFGGVLVFCLRGVFRRHQAFQLAGAPVDEDLAELVERAGALRHDANGVREVEAGAAAQRFGAVPAARLILDVERAVTVGAELAAAGGGGEGNARLRSEERR